MGENLALNLESHGYRVSVFNRNFSRVLHFLGPSGRAHGKPRITPSPSLPLLVASLSLPRRILLLIPAGPPVDAVIADLLPLLHPGDVLIDGGNSNFRDSQRRASLLSAAGVLFVGAGISSGEEGALSGLSIMPGGPEAARAAVEGVLRDIAAQVDGEPCCEWLRDAAAGHYVKMVHNGLEYCEMQLLAEAYQLMRDVLRLDAAAVGSVFLSWAQKPVSSYLIQLTAQIFTVRIADPLDPQLGAHLIDLIHDVAAQKGTGRWTSVSALELGVPASLVAEAVFARYLSTLKEDRQRAATLYERNPASNARSDANAGQQSHQADHVPNKQQQQHPNHHNAINKNSNNHHPQKDQPQNNQNRLNQPPPKHQTEPSDYHLNAFPHDYPFHHFEEYGKMKSTPRHPGLIVNIPQFLEDLEAAILATRAVAYAQGFQLLQAASQEYGWSLDCARLAFIWRGGLISSELLHQAQRAFEISGNQEMLLFNPSFINLFKASESSWREVATIALQSKVPIPTISSAIAFFDAYTTAHLPANLIQAQRDFFGAHTFERSDQLGQWNHIDWSSGRCYRS